MNRAIWLCSSIVILVLFLACGPKSIITPNVDLRKYDRVGLIGFTCNAEGNMEEFVTRWLLMTLRKYQKTARIVELGSEEEVLESVQADSINPQAIRSIGQNYDVSVIFTGNVDVVEIQPLDVPHRHWLFPDARPISGKTSIAGKRVKARVKVWITARLWEVDQGGVLWRTSAFGEEVVDHVSGTSDGKITFDASEPRQAYWDLVNPLINKICADFETRR